MHVSVLQLCKALINTAASVIVCKKRNIDCVLGGETTETRQRAVVTSGLGTQRWKGQPQPPSASLVCVQFQNHEKVLS